MKALRLRGALEKVAELVRNWFLKHFPPVTRMAMNIPKGTPGDETLSR